MTEVGKGKAIRGASSWTAQARYRPARVLTHSAQVGCPLVASLSREDFSHFLGSFRLGPDISICVLRAGVGAGLVGILKSLFALNVDAGTGEVPPFGKGG
jgi:hypothetical protein